MGAMASQITNLTIVHSTVHSGADQRKQFRVIGLSAGIHLWPVNSPHKWPITRKMFPFDDCVMYVVNDLVLIWHHNAYWNHAGLCRSLSGACLNIKMERLFHIETEPRSVHVMVAPVARINIVSLKQKCHYDEISDFVSCQWYFFSTLRLFRFIGELKMGRYQPWWIEP